MGRQRSRAAGGAVRLVSLLAGALLAGCDMCDIDELRCNGHVVQECSSTRNWEDLHDCGAEECGVGRDVCHPFIDLGLGSVWCCYQPQ